MSVLFVLLSIFIGIFVGCLLSVACINSIIKQDIEYKKRIKELEHDEEDGCK